MKPEPTLEDLMDEKLPCGKAVTMCMLVYNTMFGSMSTCLIPFLLILFKDGTPSFPQGVTEELKGDQDDSRIQWVKGALEQYRTEHNHIPPCVNRFIRLYLIVLDIPFTV